MSAPAARQGGGQGRHGRLVQRGGGHRGDGLDVGAVAAVGLDEGVLAHLGGVQELLGAGAAHRAGGGPHRHHLEAEAVEDPQVGGPVGLVRGVQAGVVHREGVGVLHDELAPAQQAGARAGFLYSAVSARSRSQNSSARRLRGRCDGNSNGRSRRETQIEKTGRTA